MPKPDHQPPLPESIQRRLARTADDALRRPAARAAPTHARPASPKPSRVDRRRGAPAPTT